MNYFVMFDEVYFLVRGAFIDGNLVRMEILLWSMGIKVINNTIAKNKEKTTYNYEGIMILLMLQL